jgi:regulatory subunit for Cdc7p protein kinase
MQRVRVLTSQCSDILLKAREMGMKLWSVEKLQRMLNALFNVESTEQSTSLTAIGNVQTKTTNREAELSQLLRNERRHAMVDRDWMADMVSFRGCYVYVHDMDEKYKPVMIRDYPKPSSRDQGKWPQLRVAAPGRCPFLDDPTPRRTATAPTRARDAEQMKRRTRAATAATTTTTTGQEPLAEMPHNVERPKSPAKPLDPPKGVPLKRGRTDQLPPLFGSAQISLRKLPRFAQGEPVASGVQPSNVTSAIRSQMISSTAAAPGGKAGSTRELNALKRKVLERNGSNLASTDVATSVRAALNANSNDERCSTATRPNNKRKALDNIAEDDGEQRTRHAADAAARQAPRKKRVVEKDPKPGYCENCRDKFEDFDEHVLSRQHRRFAVADENFKELDSLLEKLVRI